MAKFDVFLWLPIYNRQVTPSFQLHSLVQVSSFCNPWKVHDKRNMSMFNWSKNEKHSTQRPLNLHSGCWSNINILRLFPQRHIKMWSWILFFNCDLCYLPHKLHHYIRDSMPSRESEKVLEVDIHHIALYMYCQSYNSIQEILTKT